MQKDSRYASSSLLVFRFFKQKLGSPNSLKEAGTSPETDDHAAKSRGEDPEELVISGGLGVV